MDLTLTEFLRHSGNVLDRVEEGDVVLRRRDGDDLVLTTTTRVAARDDGLGLLAKAVLEALRSGEPLEMAAATALPWTNGLSSTERSRFLRDVAAGAATAAELCTPEPLRRALERWRRLARSRAAERPAHTYETRPVAIPDDVDDPSIEKASGVVELPLRVRWSAPKRTYDLSDPGQLRRVYEQVLREGTEEDIRRFVNVDELVAQWHELVLPVRVRRAWADWLKRRRGLDLAC